MSGSQPNLSACELMCNDDASLQTTSEREDSPGGPPGVSAEDVAERFAQWLQAELLSEASRDEHVLHRVGQLLHPNNLARRRELVAVLLEHLRSIEAPASMPPVVRRDPLADARLRGFAMKQAMFASGELLSSSEVARNLGVSPDRVLKMREEKRLLGLPHPTHADYLGFPGWQFDEPVLKALPGILGALGECAAWEAWLFFTSGDGSLRGFTPLEVQREQPDDEQDGDRLRRLLNDAPADILVERAARRFTERTDQGD